MKQRAVTELRPKAGLESPRIAVIGAGVAGAACAAGLLRSGFDVTVYDKSHGVGGRMATRRAQWADANGIVGAAAFDHGCGQFTAIRPRFRAVVTQAERLGTVARWRQRVYASFPAPRFRDVVVPTPDMPAFCRHLLSGVALRLGHAVTGLQRRADGWHLHMASGCSIEGPFAQVVLATPPAQAAMLLAGHHDDWAAALAAVRMAPCWTLMAVTDDSDWPWDGAELERGVFAWIGRNDRKPGRATALEPHASGQARWVAHATPAWSLTHLEDDPIQVAETLRCALGPLITGGLTPQWHHTSVHRWRHAQLMHRAAGGLDCWWSAQHGLAVCGDSFGEGSVEAAWCSGDELADAVAAWFDAAPDAEPIATPAIERVADPVH